MLSEEWQCETNKLCFSECHRELKVVRHLFPPSWRPQGQPIAIVKTPLDAFHAPEKPPP